jgi:hypothetical protein
MLMMSDIGGWHRAQAVPVLESPEESIVGIASQAVSARLFFGQFHSPPRQLPIIDTDCSIGKIVRDGRIACGTDVETA